MYSFSYVHTEYSVYGVHSVLYWIQNDYHNKRIILAIIIIMIWAELKCVYLIEIFIFAANIKDHT